MTATTSRDLNTAFTAASPDAELIKLCRDGAEREIRAWYALNADADATVVTIDRTDFDRIAAIPATTPEGWQAKALLFAAFDTTAYDGNDDPSVAAPLLTSLLRDMVAQTRNAIVDRCRAEFGPLGDGFADDGRWIGHSPAEQARIEAESAERMAILDAKWKAEAEEAQRALADKYSPAVIDSMTRQEAEAAAASYLRWRDIGDELRNRALRRIAALDGAA